MVNETKRVFFGYQVKTPWPDKYPKGRLLEEKDRHATIAFLGNIPTANLDNLLSIPKPPYKVGFTGVFTDCLILPNARHPNVVAWSGIFNDQVDAIEAYHQRFFHWLDDQGYKLEKKKWLFHVTLSRKPFDEKQWKQDFKALPFSIDALNLYESLGHSQYQVIKSWPFLSPFQEIEHTADIAFVIRGESLEQIYHHAQAALTFRYPALQDYIKKKEVTSLDDIIINLNELITDADSSIGCPFKAISFHGTIQNIDSILTWEMIVDV